LALQAVLFDLDGTLIDSHDDIFAAFDAVALEFGLAQPGPDALRPLLGLPLEVIIRRLYGEELADERVAALSDGYRRHYGANPAERTRPFPGVLTALDALSHLALGVATTKRSWQALRVMTAVGLAERFAVVQGTDDFPAKPAPDVLLHALHALDVQPEHAAYVGDGPWDMQAARTAGVYAIGIDHTRDRSAELSDAGAQVVVAHMDELPARIRRLS
jgi:phosphoglycolate phosphatase